MKRNDLIKAAEISANAETKMMEGALWKSADKLLALLNQRSIKE